MQGHNPFAQFQTSGPMGQFPNANPDFRMSQGKPQQGQFNPQQFPNPQMMQFQTMQPQMFPNMMPNQMGPNNPGVPIQNIPQQQNIAPPQKPRLIVKLENNERGFYSTMLSQVDPTERGRVEGKDAATFFRRSGLPSEVLKKIWLIATSDNKTLDKEEFYVYMRLVAYAQNNIEVSPQSIIQNIKAPLPKLQSPVPPPQKKEPSGETTPKDSGANLLDMGPTTTTPNVQMNVQPNPQMNMQPNAQMSAQGFGNLNFNNPAMTNPQQANLMGNMPTNMPMGFGAGGSTPGSMGNISNMPNMSSNMPSANLLGDTPNLMGAQDDLLGGDLPTTGSQTKIDVNPNPQIVSSGANISMNQSSPTNLKPESTLNVSNTAASEGALDESQGFSDVLVDLTPEYIKQYEDIYNQFDANKKGIVTQQEIGDVFLRSGLGNDVLFQIWSFCDTGDRGCLDKPEFMLSLHLIAMCKKKIRLPPTLPAKYEKFLKDAKKKLPAKDYLIEKARQALEESNPPPRLSHQGDEYQQRPSDYGETGYDNYEANHQPQYNEPSHARNDYGKIFFP